MVLKWLVFLSFFVYFVTPKPYTISVGPNHDEEDSEINPYNNTNRSVIGNEEKSAKFWEDKALKALEERLQTKYNENTAKNIILFLGDGMSIPTISATRVYLGGEEKELSFEKFPFTGLSRTYCVDHQVADSACSSTAYLGGVKANLGTLGVTAAVTKYNCSEMNLKENHVLSIARKFQLAGRRTGFVTTTRVTHASPGGLYAHTASRQWESDSNVLKHGEDPKKCQDIANQLVTGETGRNLNVIMGGGRKKFLPREVLDEEGFPGERSDGHNLIQEWKSSKTFPQTAKYVYNLTQLKELEEPSEIDYLLGLFEPGHMKYNLDRNPQEDPSLSEMVESAIKVLDQNEGFFLFVEGGRIDTAHHDTVAHKALDETAEFAKAVQKALDLTKSQETLIVVTSDHAHTMSFSGYASRGSNIFGYAGQGLDNRLYSIINYANGPGYKVMEDGSRYVPSEEDIHDVEFKYQSVVPMKTETHGGDDVAIFAKGPWSHLFTGTMEEHTIPHLMAFAACLNKEIPCKKA